MALSNLPKNHFGAEPPEDALEDFAKFQRWPRDGAKTEIEVDGEAGIDVDDLTTDEMALNRAEMGWLEFSSPRPRC